MCVSKKYSDSPVTRRHLCRLPILTISREGEKNVDPGKVVLFKYVNKMYVTGDDSAMPFDFFMLFYPK